ncbi:hypothetical protein GCM10023332_04140 [Luteimonas vadosa]|uniref:Uncharacterized protein n=1 Tax=Luteimonas vadosa TaxID=1165507 RepID=A0ABP9DPV3_9GAMM
MTTSWKLSLVGEAAKALPAGGAKPPYARIGPRARLERKLRCRMVPASGPGARLRGAAGDMPSDALHGTARHVRIAEMMVQRAKRLVEHERGLVI